MTDNWQEITDPEELFKLKREGWEIEFQTARGEWVSWTAQDWSFRWIFRARPVQPKMQKVKSRCFMHIETGDVKYRFDDIGYYEKAKDWIRQPHLDLEGEVPDEQ